MSEIGIRVGAAANQAATVIAHQARNGDMDSDQVAELHMELTTRFLENMTAVQAIGEFGATPVPNRAEVPAQGAPAASQSNVVPFTPPGTPDPAAHPAAAPAPAPAPSPIPGAATMSDDEALWREYFADPSQWYDNRTSKQNPKQPDFKHKTKKGSNGYNLGLWVSGKGTPAWVAQGLNQSAQPF